jgi:hypothetical protein
MCVSGSTHGLCVPLLASGKVEPGYRSVEQRLEFDVEAPLCPKTVDAMPCHARRFQYRGFLVWKIHQTAVCNAPRMHETNIRKPTTRRRKAGEFGPVTRAALH